MHVFASRVSLPVLFIAVLTLAAGLLMGGAGISTATEESRSADAIFPSPQTAEGRQIAVSDDGKTIAYFWVYSNGSNLIARTRYSTDGGKKWTNKNLSNSNKQASQLEVAVSGDGKTLAYVWVSSTDPDADSAAKSAYSTDSGKTWTMRDLSSDSEGGLGPQIALTENGKNMYFMYDAGTDLRRDGIGGYVFGASNVNLWTSSDGGNTWSESEIAPKEDNARSGSVNVSSDNRTIVYTWFSGKEMKFPMKYTTDFGANWTTTDLIPGNDSVYSREVTVSANGETIAAVYSEKAYSTGGLFNVFSYYTTDAGNQWNRDFVKGGREGDGAGNGRVAVSNDGQTLINVWEAEQGKTIGSRYSSDGGVSWTLYNPAGGDKAKSPEVTMSGDGKTWWYAWEKPGNKAKYFSRNTKNGGGSWSKAKKISQPTKAVESLDVQVSNNANYIGYAWAWNPVTANRAVQTYYSTKGGGSWKTVNLSGSSAVKKLKVRKTSGVKTQVQWKKPAQVDSNGVKKYEVRYKAVSADGWKSWKSAKPKKLKIGDQKYAKNVGKLKVGKKYEVQVRTKNSVSPGKVAGLKIKAKK